MRDGLCDSGLSSALNPRLQILKDKEKREQYDYALEHPEQVCLLLTSVVSDIRGNGRVCDCSFCTRHVSFAQPLLF